MPRPQHKGFFKDFFGTIRQDLQETGLKTSLGRDLRAIYEFYLSPKERQELEGMPWLRRWLYRVLWFLKSFLFKLTPFRRLLLLASFLVLFYLKDVWRFIDAYLVLFVVLLLELKDKLLAHDELKAGRVVQAALRPESCPPVKGWDSYLFSRSANEVGGDLVDCLKMNESTFGFMVGDVSGKGLGAALLMAQLQASVHALAPIVPSVPKLVAQLNGLYCRGGLSNSFISFIYFAVKPNSGEISFTNAGHLPPLVVQDGRLTEWQKGGPALGLDQKAKYKEESLALAAGDYFVVYTDGITEARNPTGAFFGEARLAALVASLKEMDAKTAGARIIRAVDQFVGSAPRTDDLTFLILKRTADRQ